MESILKTIKKQLGMSESSTAFDTDAIININTTFMILTQMGVGPAEGFTIKDDYALWTDFISEDSVKFEGVKTYVYLKAKMVFDPPSSSVVMQAMKDSIAELEWRLNFAAENKVKA